jgi:uncharacterized protein YvpB
MGYTVVHRTPLDAEQADVSGAERLSFDKGLFKTATANATIESPAVETPFAFDDLVGSWNADVPKGARLELQASVRVGGRWTKWYSLAAIDDGTLIQADEQDDGDGKVDVDTLKLKKKADAFKYRFLIVARKKAVTLRLAAVTVSDDRAPAAPPSFSYGPWVTELKVKPRSQGEEGDDYKHDICSPTSLAMILEFWGVNRPTVEIAEMVRIPKTQSFGHWPFNVAAAGSLGLEGWVARLNGIDELEHEIAAGRPVEVSLTWGPGELDGAPIKQTKGHLIVVIGFTDKGDVIVDDPAAPRASGRRVYKRAQFHKAWRVHKRGLAYMLGPKL